jgi:hypothetical protein
LIVQLCATILRIVSQVDSSTSLTELDDVLGAIQEFGSKWRQMDHFEPKVATRVQETLKITYTSEMKALVEVVMIGKYGLGKVEAEAPEFSPNTDSADVDKQK